MVKIFFKKRLKNGLTVILEKRELPVVSISYAVKLGARNESENEKGISHFIEHLLYKGTKNRTQFQISEAIERNGGELNGFTFETITAFWCKVPSEKLDLALEVLTDMIKNPLFSEEELEKERKVILEEIKMRKDNPHAHSLDSIKSQLFSFPFGMPIPGTISSVNSIKQEDILKKFKENYVPENLILTAVGNCNFKKLCDFAEKNFSSFKVKRNAPKIVSIRSDKIEKRKGIDQANLVFAFPIPTFNNKEHFAAEVLSVLMGGGMSSRLFVEIREKRNLAYAINSECICEKDYGYCFVFAGVPPQNIEETKKVILEEFEKVSTFLDNNELNGVKTQIIGNHKINMEDSQSQMVNLLFYEVQSDAKDFYNFDKRIKEVSVEEVKKIAKRAIENYSTFVLLPQ